MLEPLGFPLPGREGMKGRVMQAMRSVLARVLFGLSYLSAPPPQPMLFPPILSFPRKGGRDIKGERIADSYSPTENPEEPEK